METRVDIDYVGDLHWLVDEVSKLVGGCLIRGIVPTFNVRRGIVGLVACYREDTEPRRGRPPKVRISPGKTVPAAGAAKIERSPEEE